MKDGMINREEFEAMAEAEVSDVTEQLATFGRNMIAVFNDKVATGELDSATAAFLKAHLRQQIESTLEKAREHFAEAAGRLFSTGQKPKE